MVNDSLVVITKQQLLLTDLIFAEHAKFKAQFPILEQEIIDLKKINLSYKDIDSLRFKELSLLKEVIVNKNDTIDNLKQSLDSSIKKIKRRNYAIFGISLVGLASILLNIFK